MTLSGRQMKILTFKGKLVYSFGSKCWTALSQVGVRRYFLMKLPNLFFSKFTMAMKFVGGVPCSSGFHTDIHFSFGPMDALYGHHCAVPTSV